MKVEFSMLEKVDGVLKEVLKEIEVLRNIHPYFVLKNGWTIHIGDPVSTVMNEKNGFLTHLSGIRHLKVIVETKEEIKLAVESGFKVFADTKAYEVIKDRIGQWLIVYSPNKHTVGLHGREGTEYENNLNGQKFFYFVKGE